jgi:hypothetical protein
MRQSRQAHFKTANKPINSRNSIVRPSTSVRPHTSDAALEQRQVPDDLFERILAQRKQKKSQENTAAVGFKTRQNGQPDAHGQGIRSAAAQKRRQDIAEKRRADAVLRASAETTLATLAAEQMAAYMEALHLGVADVCLKKLEETALNGDDDSNSPDISVSELELDEALVSSPSKDPSSFRKSSRQRLADARLMDDVCRSVDSIS